MKTRFIVLPPANQCHLTNVAPTRYDLGRGQRLVAKWAVVPNDPGGVAHGCHLDTSATHVRSLPRSYALITKFATNIRPLPRSFGGEVFTNIGKGTNFASRSVNRMPEKLSSSRY